jgi:hypothetical protein
MLFGGGDDDVDEVGALPPGPPRETQTRCVQRKEGRKEGSDRHGG